MNVEWNFKGVDSSLCKITQILQQYCKYFVYFVLTRRSKTVFALHRNIKATTIMQIFLLFLRRRATKISPEKFK